MTIRRVSENSSNISEVKDLLLIHEDHAVILVVNEDILQDIYQKVNCIILCEVEPEIIVSKID